VLPTKLVQTETEPAKMRPHTHYKVVRLDTMTDVPGKVMSASNETGVCLMQLESGDVLEFNLGAFGLIIVKR
jgi:hypothetical protein